MHSIYGKDLSGEDDKTLIPFWSYGKSILSMAVLKLVELNKLDLDKKYFKMEATLRQLLRHEAGFSDYYISEAYHTAVKNNETPWVFEEMIKITKTEQLIFEPGHGWQYSNIGYYYVRKLIEETMNMSLENALYELLFSDLDIKDISVAEMSSDLENVVNVNKSYKPKWLYHGMLVGSLRSVVILLHSLAKGDIINHKLLNEMKDTFELNFDIGDRPWQKPGYALGLMVDNQKGLDFSYGHTGMGPDSVISVYHFDNPFCTIAVSMETSDQGKVEYEVMRLKNEIT